MKSLTSSDFQNNYSILKKILRTSFILALFSFPLKVLHADESQEANQNNKINEVFSEVSTIHTEEPQTTPPKVNAKFVSKNSENTDTVNEDDVEEKPKQKNFIDIKFVKVPEDQRPEVKIKFSKNYKKTDLSQQPEDTYQRTVIKRIKTGLTEQEWIAHVEEACSKYHPDMKKNYHIYLVDESSEKAIGNYSCEGL